MKLTAAAEKDAPLTAEQLDAARRRFIAASRALPVQKRRTSWFLPWAAPAISAAVLILIASVWFEGHPGKSSPAEVLASASKTEQNFSNAPGPIHQIFRIEISDGDARREPVSKKLSVWSEGEGGKFSSRLESAEGVLEQAVWVSGQRRAYKYDSPTIANSQTERSGAALGIVREIAQSDLSTTEVEAAFVRWVGGRPWKPVLLSSEMTSFQSADGAILTAERIASKSGPVLQLTARKVMGKVTATMILQLDAEHFQVLRASLHLESQERRIDLRFVPEVHESFPRALLLNAVFEPDQRLLKFVIPLGGSPPLFRNATPATARSSENPSLQQIVVEEIAIDFALHRIGACTGEQIEVSRTSTGLTVTGMARDAARKSEWMAALHPLQLPSWVQLRLQTFDDVLKQTPIEDSAGVAPTVPAVSLELTDSSHFLIEDRVEQYLKASGTGENTAHFAESSLKTTERILAEASALRRLVAVGGQTDLVSIPVSSEILVRKMVAEHLATLQRLTAELRHAVSPVLEPLSNQVRNGTNLSSNAGADQMAWTSAAPVLALDAQKLYHSAVVLFGPKSSQKAATAEETGQTAVPREVIDFFERLQRVEDRARYTGQELGVMSAVRK